MTTNDYATGRHATKSRVSSLKGKSGFVAIDRYCNFWLPAILIGKEAIILDENSPRFGDSYSSEHFNEQIPDDSCLRAEIISQMPSFEELLSIAVPMQAEAETETEQVSQ